MSRQRDASLFISIFQSQASEFLTYIGSRTASPMQATTQIVKMIKCTVISRSPAKKSSSDSMRLISPLNLRIEKTKSDALIIMSTASVKYHTECHGFDQLLLITTSFLYISRIIKQVVTRMQKILLAILTVVFARLICASILSKSLFGSEDILISGKFVTTAKYSIARIQ